MYNYTGQSIFGIECLHIYKKILRNIMKSIDFRNSLWKGQLIDKERDCANALFWFSDVKSRTNFKYGRKKKSPNRNELTDVPGD